MGDYPTLSAIDHNPLILLSGNCFPAGIFCFWQEGATRASSCAGTLSRLIPRLQRRQIYAVFRTVVSGDLRSLLGWCTISKSLQPAKNNDVPRALEYATLAKKVFIGVRAGMADQQANTLPKLIESSKHELGQWPLEGPTVGKRALEALSTEACKEFAPLPQAPQVSADGQQTGGEFLVELRECGYGA